MKTKILIISSLLGFPVIPQSNFSVDDIDKKIIEVNLTQRNALVTDNLSCRVDRIEILKNPPYLIYKKGENYVFCCKEIEEKITKNSKVNKRSKHN